ncbi:hypothetical protein OG696_35750 [Streptomyces sp. NBC_00656]
MGTALLQPEGRALSEMTGLLAGHGVTRISMAMKLMAIGFARSHGMHWLRTFHHSDNAATIGVNGFVYDEPRVATT